MRLHFMAGLAATVALGAGVVSAQDRASRFEDRDANGDGVLSRQEYTSTGGHPGNFRALDVNGDGVLSRDEFVGRTGVVEDQAYEGAKADPAYRNPDQRYPDSRYPNDPNVLTKVEFRKIDRNGDNRLTKGEWTGDSATFRKLDANNDGYVSSAEYVSQGALAGGIGSAAPANNFRAKDGNGDGMLSREEYGEQRTFDRVDRNRDGRISYNEYLNPPPAPGPGSTEYEFLVRDTNRDGMLSQAEFGNGRLFSRADGNRDGLISYDEFRNARRR
jgi:Ca2+-binding EF-hand superfamily protein